MKKINAVSALITGAFLALHLWVMTYSLFTGWYNFIVCKTLGCALCIVFSIHVVLTIFIFFFCHEGTAISCKKQNIGTIIQRATAILMLLLIHVHTSAYDFMATGELPTAAQAVTTAMAEVVLVLAVCFHTAVSSSKALISLGMIRTEETRVIWTRIFGAIFGISGIAAVIAVIRFFAVI